jgi:hypothetical protein
MELTAIIAEVKKTLSAKEKEINEPGYHAIGCVHDEFKRCQMEFFDFEQEIIHLRKNHLDEFAIAKVKNGGQELMIDINNIRV